MPVTTKQICLYRNVRKSTLRKSIKGDNLLLYTLQLLYFCGQHGIAMQSLIVSN